MRSAIRLHNISVHACVLTSRRLRSCYSSEYRTPELVHPVEGIATSVARRVSWRDFKVWRSSCGLVAAMLASRDFKGIRRKRLPIFMLGADHAFQASFERQNTTFSRRSGGLTILPKRIERNEPLHLLVDSTGVKIYGEGAWLDQKHGIRSRRRCRKLHLAVDA